MIGHWWLRFFVSVVWCIVPIAFYGCDKGFIDEFNGSSLGVTHGITFMPAVDGQGAVFSRIQESRVVYPFDVSIPREGTVEFWIKVESGYGYADGVLTEGTSSATIFSTDSSLADVWWPGCADLILYDSGLVEWNVSIQKYQHDRHILQGQTNFRFKEWHSIGISYGSQGAALMVDGQLIAKNTEWTTILAAGGGHFEQNDQPTIGEPVSVFWTNNKWERGFEGIVDRFRVSPIQSDWVLSAVLPGQ